MKEGRKFILRATVFVPMPRCDYCGRLSALAVSCFEIGKARVAVKPPVFMCQKCFDDKAYWVEEED